MSNPIKDAFDQSSLIQDIYDRDSIIFNYKTFGLLDREDAIKKIRELRISDKDIATATAAKLSVSSIPFSQSTNDQIIGEIAMQRDILQAKLIKKQTAENNEY